MSFNIRFLEDEKILRHKIKLCQNKNHIQQVAYSTYHNCLTQICFNCKMIRTSINQDDVSSTKEETQGDKK